MSDIIERLRAESALQDQWDKWELGRGAAPEAMDLKRTALLLTEAANEIERMRAMTTWQPITDEVKDGRKIVAWAPGFGLGALTLYWLDGNWREPKDGCGLKVAPTHYLAIPSPPKTEPSP